MNDLCSLKNYNSFGIKSHCKGIHTINEIDDLRKLDSAGYILGGGSNVLLIGDIDRAFILNRIKGIDVISDDGHDVIVKVGAGEIWHDLVTWSVDQNLGNLENLALIPGRVGAAPMQNIGAYGEEVEKYFVELEAYELSSGKMTTFSKDACRFGYRQSIFKKEKKDLYFIANVTLRLTRDRDINISYGEIEAHLSRRSIPDPSSKDVYNAVIDIRSSKLPDPTILGNAGSFFKNPVISPEKAASLKESHPDIVSYEVDTGVKLAAGWMIEQCGWKGKKVGNVGCYEKQSLVIVNYGDATGKEIHDHALRVNKSVEDEFDIRLEPEVNMVY